VLPREAATERDYRDQAGLLADAAPDLVLVEGQATTPEARLAAGIALETGLPTWVALSGIGAVGDATARAVDVLAGMAVACVLLSGDPRSRSEVPADWARMRPGPDMPVEWGGLLRSPAAADAWLDAGAVALGLLDAATPDRLAPVRTSIDRRMRAVLEAAQRDDETWRAHVRRAAMMAEGGRALWLRDPSDETLPSDRLPGGFAWIVARSDELHGLPDDHFDLIVDPSVPPAMRRNAAWLRRGGILTTRGLPEPLGAAGLRIIAVDDTRDPPHVITRREE
jgi:hypothetical protein